MITNTKTAVKTIILKRVEGPCNETDRTREAKTWKEANIVLQRWAVTAPTESYDKCDFTILFEDENTYQGRYDLQHTSVCCDPKLEQHIKDFLVFYTGTKKPDWCTQEQYDGALRNIDRQECIDFLNTYQI